MVFISQPEAAWYHSALFSYWEDRVNLLPEKEWLGLRKTPAAG